MSTFKELVAMHSERTVEYVLGLEAPLNPETSTVLRTNRPPGISRAVMNEVREHPRFAVTTDEALARWQMLSRISTGNARITDDGSTLGASDFIEEVLEKYGGPSGRDRTDDYR